MFQVVKHFLTLASDRANAAREESEQAVLQEVEDLDVIMTPEKSVAHLSPSTYGLIHCCTEFGSVFHAFIVCRMVSASLPAVPHSLLSKFCAPYGFHALLLSLVLFLCVSDVYLLVCSLFSHVSVSLCVCIPPCSLLLSTVSGEGVKERSDRVLLAPWVKFLWESYRNMMELLKNNNTIERLYADVAKDGECVGIVEWRSTGVFFV